MAKAGYQSLKKIVLKCKRKVSGSGRKVMIYHEMQLQVHVITVQQLVLGAKGNFNRPEVV
jgi:hypothetical protein